MRDEQRELGVDVQPPVRVRIGESAVVHYLSRKHVGETECGLCPMMTHGPFKLAESEATCEACIHHVHGSPAA